MDVAASALRLVPGGLGRTDTDQTLAWIDGLTARVESGLPPDRTPRAILERVNAVLFREEQIRGTLAVDDPRSLSLVSLMKEKKGTCVSLVVLYLAVGRRVGLSLHAAATPVHLFVRYEGPETTLNVETLEGGRFLDEETYRHRNRIADESVRRGIFLRPLPDEALLAHLLSNRGVLAAREGRHRSAMGDFRKALRLYPDLVAAYYNRGLEHLKRSRYGKARADFTRAVEIHPLDAQAFNNRGLANLKLGDREGARRDFLEALRIDPGQKEAARNLAQLEDRPPPTP